MRNRACWIVLAGVLVVSYQNCAPSGGFSAKVSEATNLASSGSNQGNPPESPAPAPSPQPGPLPQPLPQPSPGPMPNPNPMPNPMPQPNPQPAAAVQFYGRFDHSNSAGPRYSWSASSMVAKFTGTSVSVTLNEASSNIFYAYVVDNQPMKRFQASAGVKTYNLATGLENTTHQILLMRDSEGNEGASQFRGFTFGDGGQLMAPPAFSSKYRLEFIGDSLTAGYGNLGKDPCPFSTATESAYWSYAQQTSQLLGAAPATNISYSGIGIYRNWGQDGPNGSATMPVYYPRTLTNENGTAGSFSSNPLLQPTVVVINLGTNDFWNGAPRTADFVSAYQGLVKTVRSHYPNAIIIAATRSGGASKGYVQESFNQIKNSGESKIHFLELPMQDMSGCNGHPSKAADTEASNVLAQFIKNLNL